MCVCVREKEREREKERQFKALQIRNICIVGAPFASLELT